MKRDGWHGIWSNPLLNFPGREPIQKVRATRMKRGQMSDDPKSDGNGSPRVVPVANLREYFHDALHGALERAAPGGRGSDRTLRRQSPHAVCPLGCAVRAAAAPDRETAGRDADGGAGSTDAQRSPSRPAAARGTSSLFIAGFLARRALRASSSTSTITSRWAASAYSTLADGLARTAQPGARAGVRRARREIPADGRRAERHQRDLPTSTRIRTSLRLYEVWLKTGSKRSFDILKRLGVDPTPAARTAFAH